MVDILRITAESGDSEVRRLMRERDWSTSPLGSPDSWPSELATAVSMALSSAFPMFIAWGPELGFLYNDAYSKLLGNKHPAALGDRFQRIWSEIWTDIVPIIDRALSNKSAYFEDMPLTMERKGYPEETWFTFSYSPLHDGQGSVMGMYCTTYETTERVLSERRAAFELRVADSLRPLSSSADVIRTATRLLGQELGMARVIYGEVDDARNTFCVPRDWSREGLPSLAGRGFAIDDFGAEIGVAGRAGEPIAVNDVRVDTRTAASHGAYLALGIEASLLVPLVRGGQLQAFIGLGMDCAHRWTEAEIALARDMAGRIWTAVDLARAQAALREERNRSQVIVDSIAEGFMLFDAEFRVVQINPVGLRMAAMTEDQVLGHSHWEIWPESEGSEGGRMYREVMRERIPGSAEYFHRRPDGAEVHLEVRAHPTRDGGMVAFFRDITERKRAEEQLREADRRKDEFLAMLAHELRNPLAPISAAADLLKIGRLDEARVRQSSAIIGRQVRHMTSLVDDLLDVSRVTRGLVTLARAPVSARTIVDEAIEQVRPMFDARRQPLQVRIVEPEATVLGDKARLVQVLSNLLNNAAKYTPEERRIEVEAETDGGRLVLTVRDQGIGMEPGLSPQVFDLFTQAKRSSDRSQGGLGLGLALVKHLVELHGGSVACASPGLGQGSTFTVRLPLMQPLPGQPEAGPGAVFPGRQPRPLRLLVVDDNVDAAATLGMLLEACGHEVTVEHDSLRALERARRLRLDAALLDIGLPDMDGNELARRLRADVQTAALVLIAVTGYGQEQDRRAAFEAGFDHHLVKPVDMDRLAALLAAVQEKRGG